jgi:hypothetical protein
VSRPFNTSLRRGAGEPRDLIARVDAEVRDRIGEAVDFVCLDSMVRSRSATGLPAPAPDSTTDRAEFDRRVEAFLARLADAMVTALDTERLQSLAAADQAGADRLARLVGVQVALAKLLPDYWQRFEQVRAAYAAEPDAPAPPSGRDRPGWLDRLLGR